MSWRQWLCVGSALALSVATLLLFGVSPWTLVLSAIFLACPISVAWAYISTERELKWLDRAGRDSRGGV